MMSEIVNSSYEINRGVNCTVEFQGIKGKFLYYMVGVVVGSFFLFVLLYTAGISSIFSLIIATLGGVGGYTYISGISKKYGIHGMAKKLAKNRSAKVYQIKSRKYFIGLKR